jgi:rhodanese-related sulfurtransferase
MVEEITPAQAWEMLQSDPDAVVLDVRSRVEFDYVGHPVGAVHVPWQEFPAWQADPQFVDKVRRKLAEQRGSTNPEQDQLILALCRSGSRSRAAARALEDAGFARVYNIAQGFEGDRDQNGHRGTVGGWRFHGLPWEQT